MKRCDHPKWIAASKRGGTRGKRDIVCKDCYYVFRKNVHYSIIDEILTKLNSRYKEDQNKPSFCNHVWTHYRRTENFSTILCKECKTVYTNNAQVEGVENYVKQLNARKTN